jgi:hypothetical protein
MVNSIKLNHKIVTCQVMAYREHTAHIVDCLACLNLHKKLIAERDMVYIYKRCVMNGYLHDLTRG